MKPSNPKATLTKNTTKNPLRIDRMRGITILSQRIRELPNDSKERKREIESLQRYILNEYVRGGFRINGIRYGLDQMARYLNLSMLAMIKAVNRGGKAMLGNTEEAWAGLLSLSISEALADNTLAYDQVQAMLVSQGGAYQPFISQTVNQALQTKLQATKGLLDIAKALKGPSASTIINNTNQQASLLPANAISTHEAMKMIEASKTAGLLNNPEAQQLLLKPYQEGLPEVVATRQQGFKLADEGQIPTKIRKAHDTRNDTISID
jgi:hypothetical protein